MIVLVQLYTKLMESYRDMHAELIAYQRAKQQLLVYQYESTIADLTKTGYVFFVTGRQQGTLESSVLVEFNRTFNIKMY